MVPAEAAAVTLILALILVHLALRTSVCFLMMPMMNMATMMLMESIECADGDSASAPEIVALLAAAGGAALLDNLDSTATARAPSRPKRLMLTEGERRSWVVASTPLSSHAAQTRSAKGLSGSYRAEYVERGVTGKSAYRLCFADGRVTGMGWDADGDFQVLFVLNLVLVLLGIGSRAGPSSFLPYSLFPCPFCAAL